VPALESRLDDGRLIARSQRQPNAFAGIFDRHFLAVHRYLARRFGREQADDLASQTFVIAFERRASFRSGEPSARPWLLGIATNLARGEWRAEQRMLETLAKLRREATAGEPAPSTEIDHELAAALATLDGDQRDVLLLHAWGELSYDEIAAALDVPIGTVRSRLARARSHLRAELRPDMPPAIAQAHEESR